MITHQGIIEEVAGSRAVVAVHTEGCASCGHAHACGMMRRPRENRFTLPAPEGLAAGDAVLLELPEAGAATYPLMAYLMPALAVIAGAAFGQSLGSDAGSALGALCGLMGGLLFLRGWRHRLPLPLIRPALPETRPTCKGD